MRGLISSHLLQLGHRLYSHIHGTNDQNMIRHDDNRIEGEEFLAILFSGGHDGEIVYEVE